MELFPELIDIFNKCQRERFPSHRNSNAIAQEVSRWLPTAAARVQTRHLGFVVGRVALGKFSPSISVSTANLPSTSCSTITIIYHLGLVLICPV
jgi:hypothetical protein